MIERLEVPKIQGITLLTTQPLTTKKSIAQSENWIRPKEILETARLIHIQDKVA
jgi:hypothetical protein